ncbi:hypothetical protein OS493_013372 [Desmophyllum pertusum]|uniref:Uncharacterized protein n=1 Tax=Desmophyllum pertusum TaxID=174260 RepID=A0A9X0CHD8_9CNID|nr:hypothetical protein OS493_013372 [Desmophyllum pertusum]
MPSGPGSPCAQARYPENSPKTPVKKSISKTRAKTKDTICLICEFCLIGERCTYNVEQHSGLRQKLESILEETIDCNANSCRVCRPCGRRVEALDKKFNVVMEQVREIRGKYSSACLRNVTVKRLSKASPSPKAYKKPRQGRLLVSTSKDDDEDLMGCFQPLPVATEGSESTQNSEALPISIAGEKKPPTEKVPVQVIISYPSGEQKKIVDGVGNAVQNGPVLPSVTVASKLKELGKDHDQELLKWKQSLERDDEIKRGTEILKAEIDALTYLPELPSAAELQAYAEELKKDPLLTAPTTCTSYQLLPMDALTQSSPVNTGCKLLKFGMRIVSPRLLYVISAQSCRIVA